MYVASIAHSLFNERDESRIGTAAFSKRPVVFFAALVRLRLSLAVAKREVRRGDCSDQNARTPKQAGHSPGSSLTVHT